MIKQNLKSKYTVSYVKFILVIGASLLVFLGIFFYFTSKNINQTVVIKSFQCQDEIFNFTNVVESFEPIDNYYVINSNYPAVGVSKISNGFLGLNPKFRARDSRVSLEGKNKTAEFSNIQGQEIKVLTKLLNCKDYNIDTLYTSQVNYCYLANYSKATDYPDCSPEIKAKFGLK